MKEHIQAKLNNELRDIAKDFHSCQCLRDMISRCIERNLIEDAEWSLKEAWQPIETAPKDGTTMIIRSGKLVGEGYFSPSRGDWNLYRNHHLIINPTHWQTLPKPTKD